MHICAYAQQTSFRAASAANSIAVPRGKRGTEEHVRKWAILDSNQ